jgi:hypothetical protein
MGDESILSRSVEEWGDALRDAIRRENRARMESALFDVQRRQIIGYECYYEFAPTLVAAMVAAGLEPRQVGRRMRGLLTRPYQLQVFELIVNPLLAREQRLLTGGEGIAEVERYDRERLPVLAEYVYELVRAYRGDERFGPTAGNESSNLVLEAEEIELCADSTAPADPETLATIGRMVGEIGLHSILLHGEHRDGIFDHGLYPGPDGTRLLVREINDLANEFLPWSTPAVRMSVSGIAVVQGHRDAHLRFDLFGTSSAAEEGSAGAVERVGLLARDAAGVRPIDLAELESLLAEARAASAALFAEVAAWEQPERVLYGAHLYANHLRPFALMLDEATGARAGGDLIDEFVRRGREIGAPLVGRPTPAVSGYQATASEGELAPFFSPPTTRRERDPA